MTSAQTLAAGEAIDEGKIVVQAVEELLRTEVKLCIVVDSKDLLTTLPTCRFATERSIRDDVSSTRFELATKNVSSMVRVAGKTNLADPGTKPDSNLTQTQQILFESGCLPINFTDAIIQSSNLSTGLSCYKKGKEYELYVHGQHDNSAACTTLNFKNSDTIAQNYLDS